MKDSSTRDTTCLLRAWGAGDQDALEELTERVYRELRAMAAAHMREERPDHTLQPTALVHEVFLRMIDQQAVDWRCRAHFFGVAGRMMRRVLVDHARARRRVKRGASWVRVDLASPDLLAAAGDPETVLALDGALEALAEVDGRRAQVAELHFFAGLSVAETARALDCSPATVSRDWRLARAFLARELGPEAHGAG